MIRALTLVLALIAPLAATAQESPLPERRVTTIMNMDFYGGDIGSIFETTFQACQKACAGNPACKALTFNQSAGACFLKSGVERETIFEGAISARMLSTDPALATRAGTRAGEIAFVGSGFLARARKQAAELGLRIAANDGNPEEYRLNGISAGATGDHALAARNHGAAANLTDDAQNWLDYAQSLGAQKGENSTQRRRQHRQALYAAINAYLRADSAALRANAAFEMAGHLEYLRYGRNTIDALRLAQSLAPRQEIAEALDVALTKYGFRITDHSIDADAARPRVCVEFSEPVQEAGTDYQPYVRVAGAGDLPVEPKGNQLCVEGISHGQRLKLVVRQGLPSAKGEVLRKGAELDIYVRDRAPSVRFVGRNYVLPKGAQAAIPVVTVNLTEVALKVHRIGDRNVLRMVQDGMFEQAIAGYREEQLADRLGAPVWEGTGEVERIVNKDVTTSLPIGEAIASFAPGLYVMTARVPGEESERYERAATQWFVVTDLGLASMTGADGLHVFVRALSTALPAEGAEVRLVATNNEVLGTATSDAQGYVRFAPGLTRGTGGMAPAMLTVVGADGDYAFIDLSKPGFDLSDRGVEGRAAPGPIDLFVTTERGIYRPGETVHTTVLARDARADALGDLPLTAIVLRPDGVEYARTLLNDQGAGGYAWSLPIGGGVQRGTWTLRVHTDPEAAALSVTRFLVEDFVPERIDVVLDAPEGPVRAEALPDIDVEVRYLYGAPGADLTVEGRVRLSASETLTAWPGFRFGLADESFSPIADSFPSVTTNAEGKASVSLVLPVADEVSRPLKLDAIVTVADSSGRPVERVLSRPLEPVKPLIGVKPLFEGAVDEGGLARFEVIAIGPDGKRMALPDTGWTLSRLNRDWQWYRQDGRWRWEAVTTRARIASDRLDLNAEGRAVIEVPVDWGRYELKLVAGGETYIAASQHFSAGWYSVGGASDTPDMLEMGLDRETYALGDTVKVRLKPRVPGKVLLAVVDNRLVTTRVLDVEPGETTAELVVTEDWGPGAYVTATLIRPMDVAAGRNPSRALGLAWAGVDPGPRKLDARFTTPDEVAPRGPMQASVQIDGLAGEQAFVTIAAVDLGILNITGFDAPRPDAHYFGQRKLGVEMRDLYGKLIDGFAGNRGRLRSGGDGQKSRTKAPPPTEDLVAFYSGVVAVGPDGTATATFQMPEFNGTVRLMAVAWTARGVGHAVKDVLVRDPVVLQASLPRFLAPGDQSRLLLDLAHAKGPAGDVDISVTASGLLLGTGTDRRLRLDEGGRARLDLPLTAGDVGDARLVVTVTTPGGQKLSKTLRLGIRALDPEITRQNRIPLGAGGRLLVNADTFAGLRPGTGRATLGVGPVARFDAPGLIRSLDRYPYGCTEQLTSRAMPLIYFASVSAALGIAPREDVDARVAHAIREILQNQDSSGSFGLWRPSGGDLWLDAYVTDFLSRAKANGHAVPEQAFDAALTNLQNRISYTGNIEDRAPEIAYAAMVLAREGRASIGDLRYFADAQADIFRTPLAQAQLGAALAHYGEQARADAMFRKAAATALSQGDEQRGWRGDYGSHLRDAAGVLALAAEVGSDAVDRDLIARLITARVDGQRWVSTQEQVWMLLATNALARDPVAGLMLNGAPVQGALVRLFDDRADAVVENTGARPTEGLLTTFGVPDEPTPAGGKGYQITRTYYTMEGVETDPAQVAQNERLVVVLTIEDREGRKGRLMVDDPLPAGFEIDNPNLLRAGDLSALSWLSPIDEAEHSEFRTERFLSAVDWQGGAFQLAYIVRAVSPGRFHHPAASVMDMYRPEYRAWTDAGTVVVTAVE